MAGRKPGFRHNEETRAKIQASNLIIRLYEHVMASHPIMDATQVNAAKALLNKVLPDLSAVTMEHSGEIGDGSTKDQRDAAFAAAVQAEAEDKKARLN
jgi:hypothetical protein